MPIYEFSCLNCSKDSEQLIRSRDWQNEAKCPECGSTELAKKLSVFSASSAEFESVELPTCSGMPSNCGRCSLDN